mgnify:CR=1 FL=1
MDTILTSNGELMVYTGTAGKEVAIQSGETIVRVTMTRTSQIKLTVPDTYQSLLCGICGNYDGTAANDLSTSSGQDVFSESLTKRGQLIAQSYVENRE